MYYSHVTITYPVERKYRHDTISGPFETRQEAIDNMNAQLEDAEWFLNNDRAESIQGEITEDYPSLKF